MYHLITNPADTLDEALAYTHAMVLQGLREGHARNYAMDLGRRYFEAGAAWTAGSVMAETGPSDRRAPSPAAEKILAQVSQKPTRSTSATN